jgi:integrase
MPDHDLAQRAVLRVLLDMHTRGRDARRHGRRVRPRCEGGRCAGGLPYTLRHSFCSLLLHEGRSVIYVARQMGHHAKLTLGTYGHVIEEIEDAPRVPAEDAIRAAREISCVSGVSRRSA